MINGVDLFADMEKVDASAYRAEFVNFERSAKRLELLPSYSVQSEAAALDAFLSGATVPPFNEGWHDVLRQARKRGASVHRLRGIPSTPTPYLRFEICAGYGASVTEGEKIRFEALEVIKDAPKECQPLLDFWAFDDERVYTVLYDTFGLYLGAMRVSQQTSKCMIRLFDNLFASGKSMEWALSIYAANHG